MSNNKEKIKNVNESVSSLNKELNNTHNVHEYKIKPKENIEILNNNTDRLIKSINNNNNLTLLKQQIIKKFGDGSIFSYDDSILNSNRYSVVSTGILSLDKILGINGLPLGRIVEIFGPESSGKTTLALSIASNFQKVGKYIAFIDAEHALDLNYAKSIGVDISKILISQPSSGEECFDICTELVKSNAISLIIVDSVAAIVPRAEIEGNFNEQQIGLQARLISSALRRLTVLAAKSSCTIIFINQLRDKIGNVYGGNETTPGGRALKFFSSIRIDVRKVENIKQNEIPIGIKLRVKIVKNKCSMPFRQTDLELFFKDGISYESDLINIALDHGVITKNGAWYSFNDEKLGQGKENLRILIKSQDELKKQIESKVINSFIQTN